MTLYIDSSAWMKRYVAEPQSAACVAAMSVDPTWVTCRHTMVEVTRNIGRRSLPDDVQVGLEAFNQEWAFTHVVELDQHLCALASEVALETGARTLDALHLAGALRAGGGRIGFVTYDQRQAIAARQIGLDVRSPS